MVALNPQAIKQGAVISWRWLIKAAPTLGVIFGVCLMGGGAVKTGIETPKMKLKLDELDEDDDISHNDYLKTKATIMVYHLGLPAFMLLAGAAMILFGYKIKYAQAAVATAALAMKTDEADKLEQKILEKYGPKEYEKIKDDIAKDDVKDHPVNYSTVINTGRGNMLCYDPVGHDYFWSDLEFIRKMETQANSEMTRTRWKIRKSALSYDDWREYLELPPLDGTYDDNGETRVGCELAIGKDIGWINRPIELRITALLLPDNTPCHVIGFTSSGGPKWHMNVSDSHGEDLVYDGYNYEDDETDMPSRGR